MSKYIDAEKLIGKIEKSKNELKSLMSELYYAANYKEWEAELNGYNKILSLITSLQQEQQEVNLEVSKFCQPVPKNIAKCVAEHYWEMLDDEEKENARTIETTQQEQPEMDLDKEISSFIWEYFKNQDYDSDFIAEVDWENSMKECARHFAEWGAIHLNVKKKK